MPDLNTPPAPPTIPASAVLPQTQDGNPAVDGVTAEEQQAATEAFQASVVPPQPEIRPETVQVATYEALKRKKRRTDEIPIYTVDEAGEPVKLLVKFLALDGPAYDELVDKHPPTPQQSARGAQYGITFQSALLAACVTEPKLTFNQWEELRKDPNWSAGELGTLFSAAWRLCMGGLDVGFTATG